MPVLLALIHADSLLLATPLVPTKASAAAWRGFILSLLSHALRERTTIIGLRASGGGSLSC
jgi:hypothetical protein